MITWLLSRHRRVAVALLTLIVMLFLPSLLLAAATTDVIEMFKYTYGSDRLIYLAAQEIVLWRILSRKKTPVSGRGQWLLPLQTRNAGVWQGHVEGGAITTRRSQPDTDEASFALQEFHGIWDISWKMLQDARKDEYSFARAVDFMDASFRRRVMRLLNADLLGSGRGELAVLPATDDQTTITVRALPLMDLGLIVDLMDDSDDNAKVGPSGAAVTGIKIPTREVVTGTAGSGTASGDYYTVADSVSSAGSLHTLGLRAWISDANPKAVVGNIGGIDRSAVGKDYWQSTVLANGGINRPLTEDLILQGLDTCRERGGTVVSDLMSNLALIRRYHESLRADTFFALGAIDKFGGKVGVGRNEEQMKSGENSEGETIYQFSGIPWRAEMFMDANRVFGMNREHLFIGHGENEVPRPISEVFDDMTPFFTMPSTPAAKFETLSYYQAEMLGDNPPAHFQISDIAES